MVFKLRFGMEIKMKRKLLILLLGILILGIIGCERVWGDSCYSQTVLGIETIDTYNEKIGFMEGNKIVIKDKTGSIISENNLENTDMSPNQIALGEEGYYLLQWEKEPGSAESQIAKFDYQSNLIEKIFLPNISMIDCKNGIVFIAEQIKTDTESSAGFFVNSIQADYYVEEKNFLKKNIKELVNDEDVIRLGDITLYRNNLGYFCTQPQNIEYKGYGHYECFTGLYEDLLEQQTCEGEKQSLKLLKKNIPFYGKTYSDTYEYQQDGDLYGVCNVYLKNPILDYKDMKDISSIYFYKMSPANNQFIHLKKLNEKNIYGIFVTKDYVLYQKDDKIIKMDLVTEETKEILTLNKEDKDDITYEVQKRYIVIRTEEKDYIISIVDGLLLENCWYE